MYCYKKKICVKISKNCLPLKNSRLLQQQQQKKTVEICFVETKDKGCFELFPPFSKISFLGEILHTPEG